LVVGRLHRVWLTMGDMDSTTLLRPKHEPKLAQSTDVKL